MTGIDKNSCEPILMQMRQYITQALAKGDLQPGGRLPSEHKLAALLSVHRQTAHKMLTSLAKEGLIFSHPGRGWFLCGGVFSPLRIAVIAGDGRYEYSEENNFFNRRFPDSASGYKLYTETLDTLNLNHYDGLIWTSPNIAGLAEAEKLAAKIPVVINNRSPYGSDMPFVGINQYAGSRDIVTRLINAGHREIGCISIAEPLRYVDERIRAFKDALYAGNLETEKCPVLRLELNNITRERVKNFIDENRGLTALFVAGMLLHDAVVPLCCESKRDLTLALYDDYTGECDKDFPTVHQPHDLCFDISLRQLRRLIKGERIGSISISPEVINTEMIKPLTK